MIKKIKSDKGKNWADCKSTDPTVDKRLPQQAAHDVGAEVNNVLDLPEGLLHRLEGKHTASESHPDLVTLQMRQRISLCHLSFGRRVVSSLTELIGMRVLIRSLYLALTDCFVLFFYTKSPCWLIGSLTDNNPLTVNCSHPCRDSSCFFKCDHMHLCPSVGTASHSVLTVDRSGFAYHGDSYTSSFKLKLPCSSANAALQRAISPMQTVLSSHGL